MSKQRLTRAFGAFLTAVAILALGSPALAADPPAAPPPNSKASSPATDLQHYPKRHDVPGQRVAPVAGKAFQEVKSVKPGPNGLIDVTVYDPYPGVTADQLAANLKAKGVQGVQINTGGAAVPSTASPAYAPGDCGYGTARSEECPPIHWANNGFGHPQVNFVDYSGSNWPVDSAVYTWNQAEGIDSTYVYQNCPGQPGTHCVPVFSGNYGATGWAGLTNYQYDPNTRNFNDGGVNVYLNDFYSYNADGFRQDSCHELGHALGLAHNVQDYSCMWFQIQNNAHLVPDSDDFNMLASIYSVGH